MSVDVKHEGDVETVIATFRDSTDTLVDPSTVTLKVLDPSGNTDTYTYGGGTITKDSTGIYSKALTWDEPGEWRCEWIATGTGAGAEPFQRRVIPSHF
jgi:hypothetical protein